MVKMSIKTGKNRFLLRILRKQAKKGCSSPEKWKIMKNLKIYGYSQIAKIML